MGEMKKTIRMDFRNKQPLSEGQCPACAYKDQFTIFAHGCWEVSYEISEGKWYMNILPDHVEIDSIECGQCRKPDNDPALHDDIQTSLEEATHQSKVEAGDVYRDRDFLRRIIETEQMERDDY